MSFGGLSKFVWRIVGEWGVGDEGAGGSTWIVDMDSCADICAIEPVVLPFVSAFVPFDIELIW